MNILHILKREPDASTTRIIELHRAGTNVKVVDLTENVVSYDDLVKDIFSSDKVFCW